MQLFRLSDNINSGWQGHRELVQNLLINVFLTRYDSVVLSVFLSLILSIHFSQLKVSGGLKPIPAVTGWKVGYTLVRSPLYCRANTCR